MTKEDAEQYILDLEEECENLSEQNRMLIERIKEENKEVTNLITWIPIVERKPPCSGNYLVTIVCCDEIYTDIAYYYKTNNPDHFSVDVSEEDVIAWAEMPEPYQKQVVR